ncbi:putative ribonuclease H [Parabacteroides distasonis str. 3776 D15 iv]|uniref:Ribonuclease H n=2 Tax=Tannerellaceae TaxID=2005525 RepID=A0AB34LID7_PARDI|nr:ribonuclease H [Parabacteroides sp. AM25-14]KDS39258.1 putative ribonuclease H [Parabacteroides distasonis str. 3776 D15 i]KDS51123.1 putative ribonuclease H [Parabacteroides distasonis str. 3776 Po2 i]KDS72450.1 putative ribonuclease H [Parabacteroides distasonis str. 3776 D15 iv]
MKKGITEYQAHDLKSGDRIFYKYLGNQTVNIGEFLAIVDSIKYIIENNYPDKIIYSDSITAITWIKNKKTSSNKRNNDLKKAEIFLRVMSYWVDDIEVVHWDNKNWGEIPSDFGNK